MKYESGRSACRGSASVHCSCTAALAALQLRRLAGRVCSSYLGLGQLGPVRLQVVDDAVEGSRQRDSVGQQHDQHRVGEQSREVDYLRGRVEGGRQTPECDAVVVQCIVWGGGSGGGGLGV